MLSSEKYLVTEPHPSVPKINYICTGRGGAGNITRVGPKDVTSSPDAKRPDGATTLKPLSQTRIFAAGRGGAGNMYRERERTIFSFDEELEWERKLMKNQAPLYHIGRGGAGNLIDELAKQEWRRSSGSPTSPPSSASSNNSSMRMSVEGTPNKMRTSFSR